MENNLTIEEFGEELSSMITELLAHDNGKAPYVSCTVRQDPNDSDMFRLIFNESESDAGPKASPTFYLNDIFDEYINDENADIKLLAEKLVNAVVSNGPAGIDLSNLESMEDYDKIREYLTVKLEHKDVAARTGVPDNVLSFHFMEDIMMYPMITFPSNNGNASARISKNLLETYANQGDLTTEEMAEIIKANALDNVIKKGFSVTPMRNILALAKVSVPDESPEMFVVSSESKYLGANIMAVIDELDKSALSLEDRPYVVIPSSTHELIFVPYDDQAMDTTPVAMMIEEVNNTQLQARDLLSYKPYYWEGFGKPITTL